MSAEMAVISTLTGQASTRALADAIVLLQQSILNQLEKQPIPQIFLKSGIANTLSSNVADGVLIMAGFPIPAEHRGSLEDFNVNFTTAAGTVRLVILDKSNNIIQDLLRDISSSTNGTGKTILEAGQKMGIVGQTAGAGIFTVYVSGTLQKVR